MIYNLPFVWLSYVAQPNYLKSWSLVHDQFATATEVYIVITNYQTSKIMQHAALIFGGSIAPTCNNFFCHGAFIIQKQFSGKVWRTCISSQFMWWR